MEVDEEDGEMERIAALEAADMDGAIAAYQAIGASGQTLSPFGATRRGAACGAGCVPPCAETTACPPKTRAASSRRPCALLGTQPPNPKLPVAGRAACAAHRSPLPSQPRRRIPSPVRAPAVADGAVEGPALGQKEVAFTRLATIMAERGDSAGLAALIEAVKGLVAVVSKSKGGKLFRHVIDRFLSLDQPASVKVDVCKRCIEWTLVRSCGLRRRVSGAGAHPRQAENRRFLRQALQIKLAALHLENREYESVLAVAQPVVKELKRLDDKMQLVEVQLVESKAYYALSNYPRSRAALVSARTTANGIYCPPKVQAALDLQSGAPARLAALHPLRSH